MSCSPFDRPNYMRILMPPVFPQKLFFLVSPPPFLSSPSSSSSSSSSSPSCPSQLLNCSLSCPARHRLQAPALLPAFQGFLAAALPRSRPSRQPSPCHQTHRDPRGSPPFSAALSPACLGTRTVGSPSLPRPLAARNHPAIKTNQLQVHSKYQSLPCLSLPWLPLPPTPPPALRCAPP